MKINKTMDKKLELTTVTAAGSPDASLSDQQRRRLVRGAVAFAPLVLTLRSGALAAASCTGAKIVSIPTTNGEFSAQATDVCAPEAQICPGYPVTGDTKVMTATTLQVPVTPNGTGFRCINPQTGNFYTGNMAVLSSASAASMVG